MLDTAEQESKLDLLLVRDIRRKFLKRYKGLKIILKSGLIKSEKRKTLMHGEKDRELRTG